MAPVKVDISDEELIELSKEEIEALVANLDIEPPKYDAERDKDLEEKYKTDMNQSLDNILVVDNIPRITPEKEEKLKTVLLKFFRSIQGVKVSDSCILIPYDTDPKTNVKTSKGFMFVEFESAAEAKIALKATDGYRLDKNHVFAASLFTDIKKYTSLSDVYAPPPREEYKEMPNLKSWLADPEGRDQFVIRFGDETRLCWNMKQEEPEVVHSRVKWTDSFVTWSPRGTYLVTYHEPGVALWGGTEWKTKLIRFKHIGVKVAEFSPLETYLITYSPPDPKHPDAINLNVWDVRTGELMRGFSTNGMKTWQLKWSPDDKYFAQQGENCLRVYEAPQMKLLNKKKMDIEGIQEFSWSPTQNLISYWTPESTSGNVPARVTIIEVPSLKIYRTNNLFNIVKVDLIWKKSGDFLACQIERKKTKTQTHVSFDIFRINDKGVPVEVLDVKEDSITKFAWEPEGRRFAYISGDSPNHNVHFYEVDDKQVKLIKTLERRNVSSIYWSPKGDFCLLAGVGAKYNGLLEFWHFGSNVIELMSSGEHFLMTDAEWDPSGRYIATYVSYLKQQNENGYNIWDFKGKQLFRQTSEKLVQFLWRPRPPTLLSKEKMKEIRSNLKKYSQEFRKHDEFASSKVMQTLRQRRRKQLEEWQDSIKHWNQLYLDDTPARNQIEGYHLPETEEVIIEETVEELIKDSRNPV